MNPCSLCGGFYNEAIYVKHVFDVQYYFCSSRCLLEFSVDEYLEFVDQRRDNALNALRDAANIVEAVLAEYPRQQENALGWLKKAHDEIRILGAKSDRVKMRDPEDKYKRASRSSSGWEPTS